MYRNCSGGKGPWGLFLVGAPGYGKTHFLKHLNYIFYRKKEVEGVYFRYEAKGHVNIYNPSNSRHYDKNYGPNYSDLLSKMFADDDVKNVIGNKSYDGVVNVKVEEQLNMLKGICKELHGRGSVCIAIDNVDEYIRGRGEDLAGFMYDTFLRHLRDIMEQCNNIMIVLALTQDAYNKMKEILSDSTYSRRFTEAIYVNGFNSFIQIQEMFTEYIKLWCGNKPWCEDLLRELANRGIYESFKLIFDAVQQESNLKGKSPAAFCTILRDYFDIIKSLSKPPGEKELLAITYVTLRKIEKSKGDIITILPGKVDSNKIKNLYNRFKSEGNLGIIANIYGFLPERPYLEDLITYTEIFAKGVGEGREDTVSDESTIFYKFCKWRFRLENGEVNILVTYGINERIFNEMGRN